jgi:hypothetical protein
MTALAIREQSGSNYHPQCARQMLRRSSSAVATSREDHRQPRSGREGQHQRWDQERLGPRQN